MSSTFIVIISTILTGSARCAHVGNYTDSYDDLDIDFIKNKSSPTYQDLFYSKFLTTNDVHVDEEKAPKVKNIVVDNSTNIDNATKYIKISSSIEIPETESVILVLDALKLLWNAAITSIKKGFMPSMERMRRDTTAANDSKGEEFIFVCLQFQVSNPRIHS